MGLKSRILVIVLMLAGGTTLAVATTIDFENLPDVNFFNAPGGDQNIGTFYAGLTFGPDVTGLSATRFGGYNSTAFPPHSGDVAVWSATSNTVDILFASPESTVGLFYTSFDPLTLTAFDASNASLGSNVGAPNTDGFVGVSNALSISAAGIRSIEISGTATNFVFDDLSFTAAPPPPPVPIPEPATAILLACGLLGLAARRRAAAAKKLKKR